MLAEAVDLHDVGVLELGDGLGLRQEAGEGLGSGVPAGQGDLHGAEAVEPDLAGLVDDPHPAAAQLGEDLAARDVREGVRRRTRGRLRPHPVPSWSPAEGLRVHPGFELTRRDDSAKTESISPS